MTRGIKLTPEQQNQTLPVKVLEVQEAVSVQETKDNKRNYQQGKGLFPFLPKIHPSRERLM